MQTVIEQQKAWARLAGHEVAENGYLLNTAANLRRPLSFVAQESYRRGSGNEFKDSPSRPAKARALHSSAILVINVFDHWIDRDCAPLRHALGLPSAISKLEYEAQCPTGLGGTPPNLDVLVTLADATHVGVESKFTEWLIPKPKSKLPFSESYFPLGRKLWEIRGLARMQSLAERMNAGSMVFRHLDAAQLLKHALGLTTRFGRDSMLLYLYYDLPPDAGSVHRVELNRFAGEIGEDAGFRAMSYQSMFRSIVQSTGAEHQEYLDYLRSRYFPSL